MVTLLRVQYVFVFSVCLDGGGVGEAGEQPQFGVGYVEGVCVECVLFVAGLQPHLA